MPIRIVPATLRDLSYIAANLRSEDRAEIDCQLDHWSPALLALTALQGFAYVAELDGNPEAGFGAAEQRSGLWIAWSWGTRRMKRCVPEITRFFHAVLGPQVRDNDGLGDNVGSEHENRDGGQHGDPPPAPRRAARAGFRAVFPPGRRLPGSRGAACAQRRS